MLEPGIIFGETYRLEKRLGKGGMGEVWLARHLLLGEPRAIKLVLGIYAEDKTVRERFIQGEARNALRLAHHPNIVRIYELGQHEDIPYIVMEYIEDSPFGPDLKNLLKNRGSLSLEETSLILSQTAAALDVAHTQGLIHRDIKPANILITEDKAHISGKNRHSTLPKTLPQRAPLLVKLSDFGLTKDLGSEVDLTTSGFAMGTPAYMAPEQAQGTAVVESDIYALGVVVYEMLAGRLPFIGSAASLILQHASASPPSLLRFNSNISGEIEKVVMKALAKTPEERYHGVTEFARALQQAIEIFQAQQVSNITSDELATQVLPSTETATTPIPKTMRQSPAEQNDSAPDSNSGAATPQQDKPISVPPGFLSGTLTFLFTDIQGSTDLWEHHPQAMKTALARHDDILRRVIESNGGQVYKMIGDAFCSAFNDATKALNAAIAGQRALLAENWGEVGAVKVRMALHTCPVEARERDYVGPGLNRMARLLSVTYGDQILISQTTAQLLQDALPAGAGLRDLGVRRLKDLIDPENIFQVIAPGLPSDFPPLKTLENIPNNLPVQLTSFIGREAEVAKAKALLQNTHLLTLMGAGGTGKTRLSLKVAEELLPAFEDGVWFIELAPLSDPALVPQTVATVLNLREEPGQPLLTSLINHLKTKRVMLVLDNCEHVVAACARLAEALLKNCPELRILASSREGLGIGGETTWRLPSLSLPSIEEWSDSTHLPNLEKLVQYEAVKLFIDRASAVQSNFKVTNQNAPAVAQLCYQLDGIPLALELAAVRVRAMSVEQIMSRLDNRFRLLTGGSRNALPRQQTLKALIDWSYDLLSESEQVLLGRLSVFSGSMSLEAVEAIGPGDYDNGFLEDFDVLDLLMQLVNKSLVVAEDAKGETRYHLLESIRQYGREKLLARGEAEVYSGKHCTYYLELAEKAEPELGGEQQAEWLARLEQEHDNLRAGIGWALEKPGEAGRVEMALRYAGTLRSFWVTRGYLSEGRKLVEATLNIAAALPDPKAVSGLILAKAYKAAGTISYYQLDYEAARRYYERCGAISQEIGDKAGVAGVYNNMGMIINSQGNYAEARTMYEESLRLFRELGNQRVIGVVLNNLGLVTRDLGDYPASVGFLQESLAIQRQLKNKHSIALALSSLGEVLLDQGNYSHVPSILKEGLEISAELGDRRGTAYFLEHFAALAAALSQPERALQLVGAATAIREKIGAALSKVELDRLEQRLAAARQTIGEATALDNLEKGRVYSFEQAVKDALEG